MFAEITRSFDASSDTLMSFLSLNNFSYADDANYTCCSFHSSLCESTSIVITPTVSPFLITGIVGDTPSSFTCNVQSVFSTNISWYINDLEGNFQQISDSGFDYGSGSGSEGLGSGFEGSGNERSEVTFDFFNVTFEDAGSYQCSITVVGLGEILSTSAKLTGLNYSLYCKVPALCVLLFLLNVRQHYCIDL